MSENEYKVMKGNVWVKALLKEKRINGEWIVWKDSNALLQLLCVQLKSIHSLEGLLGSLIGM